MKEYTNQVKTVIDSHNFYKDKIEGLGIESYSGRGSCIDTTEDVRKHLPEIIKKYNINSIIDAPCGDWNWMKLVNLEDINYTGYDVIEELLESNTKSYKSDNVKFIYKDIINDDFDDKVDLIICRDFLFHINNSSILKVLEKFKKSVSKYLLSTSFNDVSKNIDIKSIDNEYGFRPINLMNSPFNMPNYIYGFIEEHPDNKGRGMYLWKLNNYNE